MGVVDAAGAGQGVLGRQPATVGGDVDVHVAAQHVSRGVDVRIVRPRRLINDDLATRADPHAGRRQIQPFAV